MLICFKKTLNLNLTYRIYKTRFYSGLCSCNRTSISKNTSTHDDSGRICGSKYTLQQCRNLSDDSFLSRYFSFLGSLASSPASIYLKDTLIQIHDVTGLPWWSTIIVTTGVIKLFMGVPIAIYQQFLMAKSVLCREEAAIISKPQVENLARQARLFKWPQSKLNLKVANLQHKEYMALVIKNNCHPFKCTILSLTQVPVWLLMSLTLRKMAVDVSKVTDLTSEYGMTALELQVGGLFWCKNLLLPDETLILSTLLTSLGLGLIELNSLAFKMKTSSTFFNVVKNFYRLFAVFSFFIAKEIPSIVSLYWTTSLAFSLCQNLVLLSPNVKRLCGIPKTPIEVENPYSHIANRLRERFGSLPLVSSKKKL